MSRAASRFPKFFLQKKLGLRDGEVIGNKSMPLAESSLLLKQKLSEINVGVRNSSFVPNSFRRFNDGGQQPAFLTKKIER